MPTRVVFKGMKATAGVCHGCTKIMIVTDRDKTGQFQTYHEDPMCDWYVELVKECETMFGNGPTMVVFGEDIVLAEPN